METLKKDFQADHEMALNPSSYCCSESRPAQRFAVLCFALFIVFLLPWAAVAGEGAQVKLYTTATVDGESVLLGQIAEIVAADPAVKEKLSAIEIGRAPLPGQSSYFHPNRIEVLIRQQTEIAGSCQIVAAGPVKVVRNHRTVSAEQIRTTVLKYIETHAPWDQRQMKVRPIRYDQAVIVPPGNVTLQISAARHTNWLGAEPFTVRIMVNGESVRRIAVTTYIEVWQEVYLAAKPIGRGQPITPAEVKVQKMDLARMPSNAIVRADQVIGKRANRAIAINSILRDDQVEKEPAIRKGDLVQVLAESQVFKVSTQAVAQENGCVGDRIELINRRSKKKIYAQVVNAETVKVEF